jgi:hypothetical protein
MRRAWNAGKGMIFRVKRGAEEIRAAWKGCRNER